MIDVSAFQVSTFAPLFFPDAGALSYPFLLPRYFSCYVTIDILLAQPISPVLLVPTYMCDLPPVVFFLTSFPLALSELSESLSASLWSTIIPLSPRYKPKVRVAWFLWLFFLVVVAVFTGSFTLSLLVAPPFRSIVLLRPTTPLIRPNPSFCLSRFFAVSLCSTDMVRLFLFQPPCLLSLP